MKRMARLAIVILGVGFISLAFAGDEANRPEPPSFSDIDVNDDALISQDEFQSFMESRRGDRGGRQRPHGGRFNPVERADIDGDGYLNEEEFNAMRENMRNRWRDRGERESL